jgi:hypothetical protein
LRSLYSASRRLVSPYCSRFSTIALRSKRTFPPVPSKCLTMSSGEGIPSPIDVCNEAGCCWLNTRKDFRAQLFRLIRRSKGTKVWYMLILCRISRMSAFGQTRMFRSTRCCHCVSSDSRGKPLPKLLGKRNEIKIIFRSFTISEWLHRAANFLPYQARVSVQQGLYFCGFWVDSIHRIHRTPPRASTLEPV